MADLFSLTGKWVKEAPKKTASTDLKLHDSFDASSLATPMADRSMGSGSSANPPSVPNGTFAKNLPHACNAVQKQVEAGMEFTNRVKKFSQKFSELNKEFSSSMKVLIESEKTKLTGWKNPDRMEGCWNTWGKVLYFIESLATAHQVTAGEITSMVASVLDEFNNIGAGIAREIIVERDSLNRELETLQQSVEKQRSKCQKSLQLLHAEDTKDKSIEENEETKGSEKDKKKKRQSFMKLLERKPGANNANEVKRWRKALDLCETYNEAVVTTNQTLRIYNNKQLPTILNQMQHVEEMRVSTLKSGCTRYSESLEILGKKYLDLSKDIYEASRAISVDFEIQNFVRQCMSERSDVPFKPYVYDLDIPLDQLREKVDMMDSGGEHMRTTEDGKEVKFFGPNLEQIMIAQRKVYPDYDAPLGFIFLMKMIHKLKGTEVEGIFRLTGDMSEILSLRDSLVYGKVQYLPSSAHVPAALLKKWLRELDEPLIEASLYNQCIAIGRNETIEPQALLRLIDNLPVANLIILRELIALWKDISSPKKIGKTKMSAENLAIVFSPTILRSPEDDPAIILQNTPLETKFVEMLITVLPNEDHSEYSLLEMPLPESFAMPTQLAPPPADAGKPSTPIQRTGLSLNKLLNSGSEKELNQ